MKSYGTYTEKHGKSPILFNFSLLRNYYIYVYFNLNPLTSLIEEKNNHFYLGGEKSNG